MEKPTLIVMAAGMGSRYGGLKQLDPIGPSGERIMDYSVYDALRAGFGKVVFVISEAMEELFKERIEATAARRVPVEYVVQKLGELPQGFAVPEGRVKPWGTGHAVYCCRKVVDGPFAVINADDFYGADAFAKVAGFLRENQPAGAHHCCMAGYLVENTLSETGHVSRGVCELTPDGYLAGITERTRRERRDGGIRYAQSDTQWEPIAPGSIVSMNMWGFPPGVLTELERYFAEFLRRDAVSDKAEFYLPAFVDGMIRAGEADVKVLKTAAKWYGVTYREDREAVVSAIGKMIEQGEYPAKVWG
jgi:NDP-sugar pyrophosphorylase family protein